MIAYVDDAIVAKEMKKLPNEKFSKGLFLGSWKVRIMWEIVNLG